MLASVLSCQVDASSSGLAPGDRAKDSRARMIRTFDQRTYVHPAARFGLADEELAAEAERARLTAWTEEEPNDGSADEMLGEPGERTEAEQLKPITEAA